MGKRMSWPFSLLASSSLVAAIVYAQTGAGEDNRSGLPATPVLGQPHAGAPAHAERGPRQPILQEAVTAPVRGAPMAVNPGGTVGTPQRGPQMAPPEGGPVGTPEPGPTLERSQKAAGRPRRGPPVNPRHVEGGGVPERMIPEARPAVPGPPPLTRTPEGGSLSGGASARTAEHAPRKGPPPAMTEPKGRISEPVAGPHAWDGVTSGTVTAPIPGGPVGKFMQPAAIAEPGPLLDTPNGKVPAPAVPELGPPAPDVVPE